MGLAAAASGRCEPDRCASPLTAVKLVGGASRVGSPFDRWSDDGVLFRMPTSSRIGESCRQSTSSWSGRGNRIQVM